ncbi:MAG: hypothetical protein BBJ60_10495 [Desulfobacterales bacterium S7086C20]|nr:MAG: hypothetical protein BBJ60_10495 [Desulfobacterales bacterium S7086C20]
MKTHRQGLSIPVSKNSPAKVLRSQPGIIQAFWQITTLFFTGEEMGGNGVPQTPPWIGFDFHCGHSTDSPMYWFSTFVENTLFDKIVVDKPCFHCLR